MPSMDKLERLCEEYSIALRLEQHKKVSELCLAICDQLVQIFDHELLQNDITEANGANQEDPDDPLPEDIIGSNEWQLIDLICQRLRKQSILAQAKEEVLQFVRQQDRVCLDQLLKKQSNSKLSHDSCAKVLRQSILLLKELQRRSAPEKFPPSSWLPTARISRLNDVAFSRYCISLNESAQSLLVEDASNLINGVLERCIAEGLETSSEDGVSSSEHESSFYFYKLISSSWFRDFLHRSYSTRFYGYNKFTILIAIWIVASDCQHPEMERLLNELVSQMFHQETNSCNLDEFLLLTEVGAVWLSYKKRMLASLQHLPFKSRPAASDEDSGDAFEQCSTYERTTSIDSSLSSSSSSSSSDSKKSLNSESENESSRPNWPESAGRPERQRAELRAIIDDELLVGKQCILCHSRPSGQPMEPIQLAECTGCSLQLKPANLHLKYCHSSFQPLDWLLPLECLGLNLKLANLKNLLVLTPNEWAQRALEVCSQLLGKRFTLLAGFGGDQTRSKSSVSDEQRSETSERVDICDKFERLTVVRRAPGDQVADSSDGGDGDDDDDDDDNNNNSDCHSKSKGLLRDRVGLVEEDEEFVNFSDGDEPSEQGPSEPVGVASGNVGARAEANCLASLEAFFRWRYGRVAALGKARALPAAMGLVSETLQAAKSWPDCEMLAVNSADLLAIDSLEHSISLLVVGGRKRAPTPAGVRSARKSQRAHQVDQLLFGCLARSQTSQLQRGCGRLFLCPALAASQTQPSQLEDSVPLAAAPAAGANGCDMAPSGRLNELASLAAVECPACGGQLVELRVGNFARAAAAL